MNISSLIKPKLFLGLLLGVALSTPTIVQASTVVYCASVISAFYNGSLTNATYFVLPGGSYTSKTYSGFKWSARPNPVTSTGNVYLYRDSSKTSTGISNGKLQCIYTIETYYTPNANATIMYFEAPISGTGYKSCVRDSGIKRSFTCS